MCSAKLVRQHNELQSETASAFAANFVDCLVIVWRETLYGDEFAILSAGSSPRAIRFEPITASVSLPFARKTLVSITRSSMTRRSSVLASFVASPVPSAAQPARCDSLPSHEELPFKFLSRPDLVYVREENWKAELTA